MITIEFMNSHTSSVHYTTCNIMYNIIHKTHKTINYHTRIESLSFRIPLSIHEIATLRHIH
jgi:hypothetical protein